MSANVKKMQSIVARLKLNHIIWKLQYDVVNHLAAKLKKDWAQADEEALEKLWKSVTGS